MTIDPSVAALNVDSSSPGQAYQQITSLSAATGLTVPNNTRTALVAVEGQAVRWLGEAGETRTVADAVTTDTDETLTSATAAFVAADVGRRIVGVGIPDGTTIASVTSATEIEMSAAATVTDTGVTIVIDDTQVPTASVGMPIAAGSTVRFDGNQGALENLRFIEQASGAKLNVTYVL